MATKVGSRLGGAGGAGGLIGGMVGSGHVDVLARELDVCIDEHLA
jgi:hypothetical protein